mgnify:FL=1
MPGIEYRGKTPSIMEARRARAAQKIAQIEVWRTRLRQVALFAAILISGGLLIIPRPPLLLIVLVICFLLKNPLRVFKSEFAGIWLLLAATVAVALIGGESFQLGPLTIRLANFLAAIALLLLYIDERPGKISSDLFPILFLMAFQAILTPIVEKLIPQFFWTFQVHDTTYQTFLYIFNFHEFVAGATFFKRPDGFFFEPGVLQMYLNILVFICLFVRRFSPWQIGVATLGVLSTQSTTGVAILTLQYVVAYLRWVKIADRGKKLVVLVLAPILLVPIALYATVNFADKVYGEGSGSAEARKYDLRTGLSVVREKPLTGIGFDYEKYFDLAAQVGYREAELSLENITDRSNSNGVVTLLYSVGIPLSLVFLLGLFRQRLFRPRLLFSMIILLSSFSEALLLNPMLLLILFSGLLIKPAKKPDLRPKSPMARQHGSRLRPA